MGGGDVTIHDAMRVDYGVSGGVGGDCTISKNSEVVVSGSVSDSYVIGAYVGSCSFSFTAYFQALPGTTSTYTQPSAIIWTLIAKSIVFTEVLGPSPLTGSLEYPFQGLYVAEFAQFCDVVFFSN
jgi:hypothetical protein